MENNDLPYTIFTQTKWPETDFSKEHFISNAIAMSLMSDEGYWFDSLDKDAPRIGSRFSELSREPLTESSVDDYVNAALESLSWLKDSENIVDIGISGSIERGQLKLDIRVELPWRAFEYRFDLFEGIYAK